jgi:hypothetical protein
VLTYDEERRRFVIIDDAEAERLYTRLGKH